MLSSQRGGEGAGPAHGAPAGGLLLAVSLEVWVWGRKGLPHTLPRALPTLCHVSPRPCEGGRETILTHWTDREAEALRGRVACPNFLSQGVATLGGSDTGPCSCLLLGICASLGVLGLPSLSLHFLASKGAPEGCPEPVGDSLAPGHPQHTIGCTGRLGTATCSGISPGWCTPWPWSPSPQASHRASHPSLEVSLVARTFLWSLLAKTLSYPFGLLIGGRQKAVTFSPSWRSQAQRSPVAYPKPQSQKVRP